MFVMELILLVVVMIVMRVNNKHVDELKASLIFVKNINGKGAFVKSVGASGILRKAQQKYLNQAS